MKERTLMAVVILIVLLTVFGCGGGTFLGNPTGTIPRTPSAECQACPQSLFCAGMDDPQLAFDGVEVSLAVMLTAKPEYKPSVARVYCGLQDVFSNTNLTYTNLAKSISRQLEGEVGEWTPVILVLAKKFERYSGNIPLDACDRAFLLRHCDFVLAMCGLSHDL